MIITLDSNFNIANTSDENLIKGSDKYDNLILKVPIENNSYYPTATFMRADSRTFGPLISQEQTMDDEYRYYNWFLSNNLLAVEGVLQITFSINITNSTGNVTKVKNICSVFAEIYDAIVNDDFVLVGGEDAIENINEQLNYIQQRLELYKSIWDTKVDVKNGKSEILNDTDMIKLTSDKIKFKTNILVRENTGDNIENEIIDSSMTINDNWIDTNLTI